MKYVNLCPRQSTIVGLQSLDHVHRICLFRQYCSLFLVNFIKLSESCCLKNVERGRERDWYVVFGTCSEEMQIVFGSISGKLWGQIFENFRLRTLKILFCVCVCVCACLPGVSILWLGEIATLIHNVTFQCGSMWKGLNRAVFEAHLTWC